MFFLATWWSEDGVCGWSPPLLDLIWGIKRETDKQSDREREMEVYPVEFVA